MKIHIPQYYTSFLHWVAKDHTCGLNLSTCKYGGAHIPAPISSLNLTLFHSFNRHKKTFTPKTKPALAVLVYCTVVNPCTNKLVSTFIPRHGVAQKMKENHWNCRSNQFKVYLLLLSCSSSSSSIISFHSFHQNLSTSNAQVPLLQIIKDLLPFPFLIDLFFDWIR